GIVNSDVIRTYSASTSLPLVPESMEPLEAQYNALETQGSAELAADGFKQEEVLLERTASIRYHLQLTEVDVELSGDPLDGSATKDIIERFDRRYAELYGENAGFKEAGRDIISQFVRAVARTPKVRLKEEEENTPPAGETRKGTRDVYFAEVGFTPTDIYDGDRLPAHSRTPGPAVLEMVGTTVAVPPGYHAVLDGYRNIYLKREP
ncbi:MAG: hypothetical protein JSV16_12135, partial [Candidatus Hydrogenedentota bacterium]